MRRWKYLDPSRPDEGLFRRVTIEAIEAWWSAFRAHHDELARTFRGQGTLDVAAFMHAHLRRIDERLCWEFGGVGAERDYLVITPEADRHLRPRVETLLERAPSLANWVFLPYRRAEDVPMASAIVGSRVSGSLEGWTARACRGEHNRVDVQYFAPCCPSPEDEESMSRAFVATESLLGEQVLEEWIGAIDIAPAEAASDTRPLHRLRAEVEDLIDAIRRTLPDRPCTDGEHDVSWTLWRLQPKRADDYAHQWDLFVGKSALEGMWRAAHSGDVFFSKRFSRFDETFCYVKLDGSAGLDEERFEDKSAIEDALSAALEPNSLGAVVGGGTGIRYSYVDLALRDVTRGIAVVREVLAAGRVPQRSWIQFFDADLAAEWVGIYADSPEPPMPG